MAFMFESLEVYKKSVGFVVSIYLLNGSLKDKAIKDQIRRASLSIPLNIAEGQGRIHNKEKRQFYNTARGSLLECIPILTICKEIGYINNETFKSLYETADEIGRMLNGLLRSVREESR